MYQDNRAIFCHQKRAFLRIGTQKDASITKRYFQKFPIQQIRVKCIIVAPFTVLLAIHLINTSTS